jgi:single-strand DNA-binding protein
MSVRSLNKVMLIGNLTRDPNLRYTPSSTAVCSFGIATNRSWTPADGGDKQERVDFHNVVAWAKLAEICGQLLHKGDKVYVEGRIQTRDWKKEDGTERRITEIVIDNMMLLSSSRGRAAAREEQREQVEPEDMPVDNNSSKDEKVVEEVEDKKEVKEDKKDEVVVEAEEVADDIPF